MSAFQGAFSIGPPPPRQNIAMPRERTEQKISENRQHYRNYEQAAQCDEVSHDQLSLFRSFFRRQRGAQLKNSHVYYLTVFDAPDQST